MLNLMKKERGFTLVELMVVILIIAILLAVAVPVFLGARSRAQNNAANQAMTNAARAVASEFAGRSPNSLPPIAGTDGMTLAEPSYTWQAEASTGPSVISYNIITGAISVKSESGANYATATVHPLNGSITKAPL